MERDPQEVIRELQTKLEEERRGRLEERREAQTRIEEERERRVAAETIANAAETIANKTAFVPFLSHCYRHLFQPVSVQKVPGLRSSGGLTKIDTRYYPRELRPWTDFPQLHGEVFGALEALFGDQELFPSQIAIAQIKRDLSPSPLANEEDLRPFEVAAIELRAKDVIAEYLLKKPQDVARVIFRSHPYSLRKHNITETSRDQSQTRSQSQSRGRSRNRGRSRSQSRSPRVPPPTSRHASKRPATSPPRDSDQHSPKRSSSAERRSVPDRWCIAQDAAKVRRALFTVEYKAGHKAMPEMLMTTLDGRLSDVTLFAEAAEAARRAEEKRQRSNLGNIVSAEEEDGGEEDSAADPPAAPAPETSNQGTSRSPSPSQRTARNRTAQMLTQAFHYMVDSGLAYSYISTGESLILLYIDYVVDPSVLYYHLSVPRMEIRLPGVQEEDSLGRRPAEPYSSAIVRQTPVALVLTLIVLALQKTPLSFEAKQQVKKLVKTFPHAYDSNTEPSDPKQAPGDAPAQQAGQSGSQSSRRISIGSARPPQQPYCTQKCLGGLRLGLALDQTCPNVALHRCSGESKGHRLTHTALLQVAEAQLTANLDDGCVVLDGHGKFGAVGALFKVTVYPQGYTLVAKGVQDDDRDCLDWEERVYQCLAALQGSVVPVCLGLVDLRRAYVLTGGARVSRLMLLSYAGETAEAEQVDKEAAQRLSETLRGQGVEHGDLRLANVLWSKEQQRLMVIDFDRATLHTKRKRSVEAAVDKLAKKPNVVVVRESLRLGEWSS